MKTELKLKLIELAGLTAESINEHYEGMLNRWKYDNSDEVWIDGRLIDHEEKIHIVMGMFNIEPQPKEIIVSELKAGFKLTEQLFIKSMIYKLNSFVNIDKPDDKWQMRVNSFLEFLKERQSEFYVDVFDFMADVARLRYCDVIHGYQERIKLFSEVDRLNKVLEFADNKRTEILNQILDSDFHHFANWKLPIGDDFGNPDSKEILNDRIQQLSLSVGVSAKYKVFDISLLPKRVFSCKNWQFDFDLLQRSNDIINLVANIGYVNFLSIEIEKCNDFIQQIESKKQLPLTDYEKIARNIIAGKYPIIVQGAICETFEDYIEQERKHCTDPNFYKTFIRVMGEVCTAKKQGNYDTGLEANISDKYKLVLDYCIPKLNPQSAPQTNNADLICDKKTLQTLHAEFDGVIWESVTLETFLDFMRVEPIGQIQAIGTNKQLAKWLRENIEYNRSSKLVPNMGKWFTKLIGKSINYSTLVT
jgi:hypothetical protein